LLEAIIVYNRWAQRRIEAKPRRRTVTQPKETRWEEGQRKVEKSGPYFEKIREILKQLEDPAFRAKIMGPPREGFPQFDEPQVRILEEFGAEERFFTSREKREMDAYFSRFDQRLEALNVRSEMRDEKSDDGSAASAISGTVPAVRSESWPLENPRSDTPSGSRNEAGILTEKEKKYEEDWTDFSGVAETLRKIVEAEKRLSREYRRNHFPVVKN
jgi:hypothetical protein